MKKLAVTAGVVFLIVGSTFAVPGGKNGGGHNGRQVQIDYLTSELNLSAEQVDKLKAMDMRGGYHNNKGGKNGARNGSGLKNYLDLSDSQIASLDSLRGEQFNDNKDNRDKIKRLRKEIYLEVSKAKPNNSLIEKKAGEIGEIHKALTVKMANHILDIKKILTPEQFSKFLERRESMARGMRKGASHK